MKIGVQMYTVRDYCKSESEIELSLKKIKAMGFTMIQVSGFGPHDNNHLAEILKGLDIEVCGTHSPWDRIADKDELKKLIKEHKKIKCTEIGLGAKPEAFPNSYEGYTRFIARLNDICKTVRDAGLTFGYHNHAFEFQKFRANPGAAAVCAIDRLIEECPELNFIPDVFWIQTGGANPGMYLDKLKGRVKIVHFKDYRVINGNNRQFAEIGEGNLDWADIIPRCERCKIPYAVIEQDGDFLTDPFESLALSRKYLVDNGYCR